MVDLGRIELPLSDCQPDVLPLNYRPVLKLFAKNYKLKTINYQIALVVQWIELRRPKAKMGVRFFPRAWRVRIAV